MRPSRPNLDPTHQYPSLVIEEAATLSKCFIEAEYCAIANTITKSLWIGYVLAEIRIVLTRPIKIYCDNVSAIYITTNLVLYNRSKHIKFDYHITCERVTHGDL